MKQIGVLTVILLCLTACGKQYEYRHLDGMWQMRRIQYTSGETEQAENLYYSFQLHIINIRKLEHGEYYGKFCYTGDSMHVDIKDAPVGEMKVFGMNDTIQHFKVEQLTSSKLVLQSAYARLEFRKY
ncbi:MAG: lipocalin-like domain-containing protein [Bacteroides sp.]